MKILFTAAANSIHTVKWVNALSKQGDEVHLVTLPNHSVSKHTIDSNVKIHILKYGGSFGYFRNAKELKTIFDNIRPDIVNAHYASGYGTLVRKAKIPYVLSIWGSDVYDFPYKNKINMSLVKKNLKSANIVTSTSNCMAKATKKIVPKLNVEVIPFGVDLSVFKKRRKSQRNDKLFVLGTIKTLEEKYRIIDSVKAVHKLLEDPRVKEILYDRQIDYEYRIYGDGDQRDVILDYIKENQLTSQIKLMGYIPNHEVVNSLNHFDAFLATSSFESFGVAVVEAMACEVPVIVSNVDGFLEVINNGEVGQIVKSHDIEDIKEKLLYVMMNSDKMQEIAKLAKKRVLDYYDFNKNVQEMRGIYERFRQK